MTTLRSAVVTSVALSALCGGAMVVFEDDYTGCVNRAQGMTRAPELAVYDDSVYGQGYGNDLNEPSAWVKAMVTNEVWVYERPLPLPRGRADVSIDYRVFKGVLEVEFTDGEKVARVPAPDVAIGRIHSCSILLNEGHAEVYVARRRRFEKETETDLGFTPTGFNFIVSANCDLSFTRLRVTDGDGLPDFSAARLYAARESIEQPIAEGASGQPPVAGTNTVVALDLEGRSGVRFTLGATNRTAELVLTLDKGKPHRLPIRVEGCEFTLPFSPYGFNKGDKTRFADAVLKIGNRCTAYVKPKFGGFAGNSRISSMGVDLLRDRNLLPPASRHPFDLRLVRRGEKLELWLDGSYVDGNPLSIPKGRTVTAAEIRFGEGVEYGLRPQLAVAATRFTPLDFSANPRARTFVRGELSGIAAGLKDFDGVPVSVAAPLDSADLAICRQAMGNWWFEVDPYLQRSPLYGFPGEVHYRVPSAPYGSAALVFAIDPDPKKEAVMTLRLGHYLAGSGGSGKNMLGDRTFDFTKGVPDWCRKVGEVTLRGAKVPLYYGEFPLEVGNILDEFTGREYLDFDVFGRPWENFQQLDNTVKPDPESTSAITLFGATLVKLPWNVRLRQKQVGNVYTVDERDRGMSVEAIAERDGAAGGLRWTAKDVDGKVLFRRESRFRNLAAGTTYAIEIAFGDELPIGYYSLEIEGLDETDRTLFTHRAAFAVVPSAGRNVPKQESPYASWWATAHGSPNDPDIGFPLLTRMGVKRITCHPLTEEDKAKWDVTDNGALAVPRDYVVTDPAKTNYGHFAKGEDWFVAEIRKQLAKRDHADHLVIWHECGPYIGVPEELLGLEPVTNKWTAGYGLYLNEIGRIMRKHFPEIRLQVGNLSSSMSAASVPFRGGAKGEYYDSVGVETMGQTVMPEFRRDIGLLGMLASQDVASRYAGRKVPVDGCWEFLGRSARNLGERTAAAWNMRDNLICLAHDFHLITTAGAFECLNSYFHTVWGGGSLRRAPYYYPYPKYVAYSVFTKVFDGVKFSRSLDTGSTTVYAMEYRRRDGKFISAFWCARGEAGFEVGGGDGAEIVEMFGATRQVSAGTFRLDAGEAPVYVVSGSPLGAVRVVKRTFSHDEALAKLVTTEVKLPRAAELEVAPDPAVASVGHEFFPVMTPGAFKVRDVVDEERGECLEVALDLAADPQRSPYYTEYTTLRFPKPIEVAGEPELLGAWVKGDSNWGQLRFEIEDASGRVYRNVTGRIDAFADGYDWPAEMAVNFDGWCFVHIALRETPLSPARSPGRRLNQWGVSGARKDAMKFPIRIRAVTVGMNRRQTTLFGFVDEPGPATIRIKSLGAVRP